MVQPLDLQIFARLEQIAGNLQLEQALRTGAENTLSTRLDRANERLDARVDSVAHDLQLEQAARTALSNRLDTTNARLDDIKEEFDGQIEDIRTKIEELEDLIAYLEYCTFAEHSLFHELLERIGITTVEELREREPEELHREMSRIAEQEPHYQGVPAVRRRRVTDEIIRWSRRSRPPSGDDGRPTASPGRRRPGGRGTQTG
jgi:chromosome segregation ATPase